MSSIAQHFRFRTPISTCREWAPDAIVSETDGVCSDLENMPNDLRNILERALGEDASVANLDKFLPRIREIIINLLQGLKRKQQIHRLQSGESAAPAKMRRTDSQGSSSTVHSRQISNGAQQAPSMSVSTNSVAPPRSSSPSTTSTGMAYSSGTFKPLPPTLPTHAVSSSYKQPPRRAPDPPSSTPASSLFTPAPPIPTGSDPVSQLSKMTLERRSSKRFSENYLARLTSSPNADRSGKLSVDEVRKHLQKATPIPESVEDESTEDVEYSASRAYGSPAAEMKLGTLPRSDHEPSLPSPTYKVIEPPRSALNHLAPPQADAVQPAGNPDRSLPMIVFVKHNDSTKKASLDGQITISKLKDTVSKMFQLTADFTLHTEDPVSRIAFELEDSSDLKQRAVLLVRSADESIKDVPEVDVHDSKKEDLNDLRQWLDQRLSIITKEIVDLRDLQRTSVAAKEREFQDKIENVHTPPSGSAATPESKLQLEKGLRDELARAEKTNTELSKQILELQSEISKNQSSETQLTAVSPHREQVMSMSAKHEHRGTELTSKLEEAMNTMERIRKDVLQRKVTPRPQQLTDLTKDFEDVRIEADALAANLVKLDVMSNKLWEDELTVITTEQETLDYQRMFLEDIKADLEQSLSSLATIKQVEEQKRVTPIGSVPTIVATATDPSRAIKLVQADIKSLHVNHEKRAAAIADAEKQRAKEKEYLMENDFKNELGAFVESNGLKDTGGAAQIDRLREQRDEAHRKILFTPDGIPKEESSDGLSAHSGSTEATTQSSLVSSGARPDSAKSVSSASILARIDASKKDFMDKRRTSMTLQHSVTPERPRSATSQSNGKQLSEDSS